jgi:hypothetical protein
VRGRGGGGGGGRGTECRSAQENSGTIMLEGEKREVKLFQIGSYKKKHI